MLFFIGWLCMSRKNSPFPQTKSFPFTESFTLFPQKPLVFATKTPLFEQLFTVRKSRFFMYKNNLSLLVSKTAHFHKPKAFSFAQTFPYSHPKHSFFCPPPLPTTLNLLSAKNSLFHKPKAFLLHKPFLFTIPSNPFPPSASPFNVP